METRRVRFLTGPHAGGSAVLPRVEAEILRDTGQARFDDAPPAESDTEPPATELKHVGGGRYRALIGGVPITDPEGGEGDTLFPSKAKAEAALKLALTAR